MQTQVVKNVWSEKIAGAQFRLADHPVGRQLQRKSFDTLAFGGERIHAVYADSKIANEWCEIYDLKL